jgi:hypothetical protein
MRIKSVMAGGDGIEMQGRARSFPDRDGVMGRKEILSLDPPAFPDIYLAREITIVLIFILGKSPSLTPSPEFQRQFRILLDKPEQAQGVIPETIGESISPGPSRSRPGPILLGEVC